MSSAAQPLPVTGAEAPSAGLPPCRRDRARLIATCDGVIDLVAALYNVPGRELRQPGRSTLDVARVRQIAMYVAHVTLGLSQWQVGAGFGRDRTTVLYACRQIEDLRDEPEFERAVAMTERVVAAAFRLGEAGDGGR